MQVIMIRISSSINFTPRKNVPSSSLNKRILRFILDDFQSTYNILMDQVDCANFKLQEFVSEYPIYMMNMFNLGIFSYNLRGNYILTLPVPKTTTLMAFILFLIMLLNNGTYNQTQ